MFPALQPLEGPALSPHVALSPTSDTLCLPAAAVIRGAPLTHSVPAVWLTAQTFLMSAQPHSLLRLEQYTPCGLHGFIWSPSSLT